MNLYKVYRIMLTTRRAIININLIIISFLWINKFISTKINIKLEKHIVKEKHRLLHDGLKLPKR